ncbi:MAG: hemerythrin domain-containing protein [Candidatus Dormibacterales bacterium]
MEVRPTAPGKEDADDASAAEHSLVSRAVDLAEFSKDGFGRQTLVDTGSIRAVIAALEEGQEIPPHAPPLDVVMTIVDGTGEVMAGNSVWQVRAGDVVVVAAGQTRGLRAVGGRLVAVNVVSPPPRPGDHAAPGRPWPPREKAPDLAPLILEEHGQLFLHLDHLARLASKSGSLPDGELRARLGEILRFLREDLMPHASEEERSVYPAAEKILRAVGGVTRTMEIDHRFIGEMVDGLEGASRRPLGAEEREHVRRLLYGLEAMLRVHFTKENEAYVPFLDRLSAPERRELHARLTGGEHGGHHHHEEGP